jgi:hypothetical protein
MPLAALLVFASALLLLSGRVVVFTTRPTPMFEETATPAAGGGKPAAKQQQQQQQGGGGGGGAASASTSTSTSTDSSTFVLTSSAFATGEPMPPQYTCTDATGQPQTAVSPPLAWTGAPEGTVQYLLAMSTTDAATATTTYDWSVYNIPPTVTTIPENDSAAAGTIGGTNPDFEYRYRGPCATTAGTHEYHIKVRGRTDCEPCLYPLSLEFTAPHSCRCRCTPSVPT